MGKGFRHGNGGMNPLNYKVVGNPQPAGPRENTIWINTDTKITDHVFSIDEPEKVEGRVWIYTGFHSMAAANVLKKNTLMVYPASCKQVIGGAWVEKPGMTYIGGEWVEWITYLFKDGATDENLVGEWIEVSGKLTMNEGSMTISGGVWNGSVCNGLLHSKKTVDLSHFNTLEYVVDRVEGPETFGYYLRVLSELPGEMYTIGEVTAASRKITTGGTYMLDVSELTGPYYVCVYIHAVEYGIPEAEVSRICLR